MKKMSASLRFIGVFTLLSCVSSVAYASSFIVDLSGSYSIKSRKTTLIDNDERSPDSWEAAAKIFFKPVSDENGPLLEADFIEKSFGIDLRYRQNPFSDLNDDRRGNSYGVKGVAFDWLLLSGNYNDNRFGDDDLEDYQLKIGAYVAPTITISAIHNHDQIANDLVAHGADVGLESENTGVHFKWLAIAQPAAMSMELTLSSADIEGMVNNTRVDESGQLDLNFGVTVYPTYSSSLYATVGKTNFSDVDIKTVTAGFEYIYAGTVGLFFDYSNIDYDLVGPVLQSKTYNLGLRLRL